MKKLGKYSQGTRVREAGEYKQSELKAVWGADGVQGEVTF